MPASWLTVFDLIAGGCSAKEIVRLKGGRERWEGIWLWLCVVLDGAVVESHGAMDSDCMELGESGARRQFGYLRLQRGQLLLKLTSECPGHAHNCFVCTARPRVAVAGWLQKVSPATLNLD